MTPIARRSFAGLAGLVSVAFLVSQGRGGASSAAREAAPEPQRPASRVVAEGRLITYPGAEVLVGSEVSGTIVALPLREKQVVKRGQLVAELLADDFRAELAEARARLAEAEAEIRLAELELERAASLLAKKVDTASRRDRALRDLEVAQARRATAAATGKRIEAEFAKRRIVAPIDGVVVFRHADAGEAIEARAGIVTIADLSQVRIEAEVDEFDAGRLTLGQPVSIAAEGYEARFRGTVEEIPDAVSGRRLKPQDPGKPSDTRVLLVKIRLEEPTPLKLGQRVEVEIGAQATASPRERSAAAPAQGVRP